MFGFLNIYKPTGMTSHDVVAVLRRITNIRQIGHTGTLDPFAEGVLPICIGKATRLIEFLGDDKEYLATVRLGQNTTTYDLEGEITSQSDIKVTEEKVRIALKDFEGEIEQVPPIYSAIKVNGKKLYDYARNGEDVEVKPRKICIYTIELKKFDEQAQVAEILVKCSKGTYIRSIAYDLGQKLGTGGHLIKLVRTRVGNFSSDSSLLLQEVKENFSTDLLINPLDVLELPTKEISETECEKIRHGQFLKNDEYKYGQFVILIYNKNVIGAVGVAENDKIKMKKVFL